MKKIGAALLLTFFCLALHSAPSFRMEKNYPATGLRFKTLGNGGEPEPIPQPKTYTYTFTRGNEVSKKDLYDPRELWYATQHQGQWRDKDDNILILGKISRKLPDITPTAGPHVLRSDFDRALEDASTRIDPERVEDIRNWVAAFSGTSVKEPIKLRPPFRLSNLLYFPSDSESVALYAFRVKGSHFGTTSGVSDWFCLCLKIGDGSPTVRVRREIESQFLPSISPFSGSSFGSFRRNSQELKTSSSSSLRPTMPQVKKDPVREAAKRSIANMQGWWYAESREYIFLSDVRSSLGKNLVRTLQRTMSPYRAALVKLIPPFSGRMDVNVMRIFEKGEDYRQFISGKNAEWSSGLWSPMDRELIILSRGKEAEKTMETIHHESLHQYLFYAHDMIENAMWYNEGHACFCEGTAIDARGRVTFNETDRLLHLKGSLAKAAAMIPSVLKADRSAFYCPDRERLLMNYTTSWALIYFLRKGAPSIRNFQSYAKILPTYEQELKQSKSWRRATEVAFEGVDMEGFQQAFIDFWKRGRSIAKRYDPLNPRR